MRCWRCGRDTPNGKLEEQAGGVKRWGCHPPCRPSAAARAAVTGKPLVPLGGCAPCRKKKG